MLKNNNYPSRFINKHIKNKIDKIYNKKEANKIDENLITPKHYVSLDYILGLSEKLDKRIR